MKLNQMQAFQEIMLTGSVSEAARNLHRSQPAISASIATLENELEMKLFERRNGRLHPVPEAHYLLQECSELLGRVDTLRQNMKGIKALKSGKLEIVTMPGPSVFLLPELIANFAADKPAFESELMSRSSEVVYQLVAAQQFDLGIADHMEGKTEDTSLINSQTFKFDCVAAIPSDDPLNQYDILTPELLSGKPVATLYSGHEAYENLSRVFQESRSNLNVRFKTRYFIPHFTYVEKGLAYGMVDPIAMDSYQSYKSDSTSISFKPFYPSVGYRISILRPAFRPASLMIEAFQKELCDKLMRLGGQLLK